MYEQLRDLCKNGKGVRYHYYVHSLTITSPIIHVEEYNDGGMKVFFEGGQINVWDNSRITKARRPSNLIVECEECYEIKNEYDEHIGFIYTQKR